MAVHPLKDSALTNVIERLRSCHIAYDQLKPGMHITFVVPCEQTDCFDGYHADRPFTLVVEGPSGWGWLAVSTDVYAPLPIGKRAFMIHNESRRQLADSCRPVTLLRHETNLDEFWVLVEHLAIPTNQPGLHYRFTHCVKCGQLKTGEQEIAQGDNVPLTGDKDFVISATLRNHLQRYYRQSGRAFCSC